MPCRHGPETSAGGYENWIRARPNLPCPLCLRKRTCAAQRAMSAMGQYQSVRATRLRAGHHNICHFFKRVTTATATITTMTTSAHISSSEIVSRAQSIICAYSITSSARASRVGGTTSPNVLAVCRLMARSNLVARRTGRSAGLSPLRMRPL